MDREVNLVWVPGHSGVFGNEMADELARRGADEPPTGPSPMLPIPLRGINCHIDNFISNEIQKAWDDAAGCKTAKSLLPLTSRSLATKLLNLKSADLALCVGLITGHTTLNDHLHRLGIRSEPDCNCGHLRETALHFLCECPIYCLQRLDAFNRFLCYAKDIASASPLAVLKLARACRRF